VTTILRRVVAGMGANAFGQSVSVGIQLLSLPIFLHHWSTSTYGAWLLISAIPAYLSMSDIGMVPAVGNRMTIAMGRNDAEKATVLLQSATAMLSIVCAAMALILIPTFVSIPLPGNQELDSRIALIALSLGIFASLFGGLAEAVFRAISKYPLGASLGNVVRLVEWLGALIGLAIGGNFASVALGSFTARLLGTVMLIVIARSSAREIKWGIRFAHLAEIKALLKPALAFTLFPIANALSFQGITLLVGTLVGPTAVTIFSAYRTIARVAVQVSGTFGSALWPEFSHLFGRGGVSAINALYLRSARISSVAAAALSIALFVSGPLLLKLWTGGAILFDRKLMALMLVYSAVGGSWHIPRTLLMATNHHTRLAKWALIMGIAVVALAAPAGCKFGLSGIAVAMLVVESAIAAICFRLAKNFLRSSNLLME